MPPVRTAGAKAAGRGSTSPALSAEHPGAHQVPARGSTAPWGSPAACQLGPPEDAGQPTYVGATRTSGVCTGRWSWINAVAWDSTHDRRRGRSVHPRVHIHPGRPLRARGLSTGPVLPSSPPAGCPAALHRCTSHPRTPSARPGGEAGHGRPASRHARSLRPQPHPPARSALAAALGGEAEPVPARSGAILRHVRGTTAW